MTVKHALLQEDLGMVNAMRYAASPSAHNSATLAAALAAIGSTPTTLYLEPATWTLTSSVGVPATCTLALAAGAVLDRSGGVTLTLANPIQSDDPVRQLFSGTGSVVFSTTPDIAAIPQWWGAVGDGVANDLLAIRAAFAASRHVHFPAGTYYLGDAAGGATLIDLSSYGRGITITTEGVVTLICNTNTGGIPSIFFLANNPDFYCGPIHFQDLGYDDTQTWKGAFAFYITNPAAAYNWGHLFFEGVYGEDLVGVMAITAGSPYSYVNRIKNITIVNFVSTHCYYGLNCQNEGDDISIQNLYAYQNKRAYFVYGCSGHTVSRLYSVNAQPSSGHINIARLPASLDTSNINIKYISRGNIGIASGSTHVLINHIDLLGGQIRDITVDVDIITEGPDNFYPVRIINYTGSGGSETGAASNNYVMDIHLRGTCGGGALPIDCTASLVAKRQMSIVTGQNFLPGEGIFREFQLTQQARGLSTGIVWGASGDLPSLGDGILTYDIDIFNGMAMINLSLVAGSTTTFGTQVWYFTDFVVTGFQLFAKSTVLGVWHALDSSLAVDYSGVCRARQTNGGGIVIDSVGNAGNALQSTFPFTWDVGDTLNMTILIPISG